jgi:hypothetical protein
MSGRKYKLLRKEAEKYGIPYKMAKNAFKKLSREEQKRLLTINNDNC